MVLRLVAFKVNLAFWHRVEVALAHVSPNKTLVLPTPLIVGRQNHFTDTSSLRAVYNKLYLCPFVDLQIFREYTQVGKLSYLWCPQNVVFEGLQVGLVGWAAQVNVLHAQHQRADVLVLLVAKLTPKHLLG